MLNFHVEEGFLLAADGLVVGEANESYMLYFICDGPLHQLITEAIALFALLDRSGLEDVLFKHL